MYKAILALSNPDKALVFSYLGDDPKSTWELTKEVPLEDKIVENVLRGIRTKNKLEGAIELKTIEGKLFNGKSSLGFVKGKNYDRIVNGIYFVLESAKYYDINLSFLGTMKGKEHGPYHRAEIIRLLENPDTQFNLKNKLGLIGDDFKPLKKLEELGYVDRKKNERNINCELTGDGYKLLTLLIRPLFNGYFPIKNQLELRQLVQNLYK